MSVFGPIYTAITEWKGGHITEAISVTLSILNILRTRQNDGTLGYETIPTFEISFRICEIYS